jgi:uncharacterized protein YndB with AHSA1/START domain
MTTTIDSALATQAYTTYIAATPAAIFEALTNPDQTDRYGYQGRVDYELRAGGAFRAHASEAMRADGADDVLIVGEILEADLPRKLVQTWNPLFGPPITDEPETRLTWELEELYGVTKVTLTHDLDGAPLTAGLVGGTVPEMGGGWAFVLSDLKTFLETGKSMVA